MNAEAAASYAPVRPLLLTRGEQRGYQTNGTEIVRPSRRSTTRTSSVIRTSFTRSPGLTSEILMPRPQQLRLVVREESLDPAQFNRSKPKITRQGDWRQPA